MSSVSRSFSLGTTVNSSGIASRRPSAAPRSDAQVLPESEEQLPAGNCVAAVIENRAKEVHI